jgi:hypothetical protein
MNIYLFMKIVIGVLEYDDYFLCKKSCTRFTGFTSIQKNMAALRCLSYGAPPDTANDYFRIAEYTAHVIAYKFCCKIIEKFRPIYLRAPNDEDTNRILEQNVARRFPRMLGSIECMH